MLREGESIDAPRVMASAGHTVPVGYHHFVAEIRLSREHFPGFGDWLRAYDDVPAAERHVAVPDPHMIEVNDRDRPLVTPARIQGLGQGAHAGPAPRAPCRPGGRGVTDIAFQPAGDICAELEAFAAAARG